MCIKCSISQFRQSFSRHVSTQTSVSFSRRAALASMAGLVAAPVLSSVAHAAPVPKPQNQLSSDAALARLMQGNERYVNGQITKHDFASTREALAGGQNPYACLLSCADSRVGPEFCFDESRGDLFVTRVAGNYVTPDVLASLEYGVVVLKSPLIMVLGHTQCGAIGAAIDADENHTDYPGHIQAITTALAPAVKGVKNDMKDPAAFRRAVTIENIRMNVRALQMATPLLRREVEEGRMKVVGGLYHLDSGKVEMMS